MQRLIEAQVRSSAVQDADSRLFASTDGRACRVLASLRTQLDATTVVRAMSGFGKEVEVVAALRSGQRREFVADFLGRLRGARSGTRIPVFGSTDSSSFAKAPHLWLIFFVWEPRGHQSTPPLLIRSSPNFPGP